LSKNAGTGSVLIQSGSTTLPQTLLENNNEIPVKKKLRQETKIEEEPFSFTGHDDFTTHSSAQRSGTTN
jgi:hypothetical protein